MSAQGPSADDDRPRAVTAPARARLDDKAFDELFRESAADVHAYVISVLGNRAAAEDVTALAFERLYRARARLDHGRGTPRAWLFAIARNAALDELRRRSRQAQTELRQDASLDNDLGEACEDLERRAAVREALAGLPPREREVVLL